VVKGETSLKRKGFTLIELLIVIAIILILIAIALPNFLEAQIRAKVTQAASNERTIAVAMESYLIDFKTYPTDHDPDDASENGLYQLTSPIAYLTSVPQEPFAQASGILEADDEIGWEMGSTGNPPFIAHITPTFMNSNIFAYGLASFGPDVDDDFPCGDEWPLCAISNPCSAGGAGAGWTNYAPTNGTKSNGDIMQIGGEWRSGSYCVNGWQWIRGRDPRL
jgi:prepilin-type N-terminal cleavage/methylation domain-containing protein